ncbi:AraC family transcriptional regulator [Clostridium estertheticum]|uniref:AraC family transcriptional regulator n=1 Tax=Clostridium estertheticum TaxID=238834 RepID=A0A5N7IM90_9CLOT|nr:AraC family transcriptional regulator [Clostridium estertheticum]MPQ31430.1 AraC family transcriptional regulator [Clostridium estertheticum]MPQ62103.1 AraC family transcriptional regulator [Clostridium estertheticum]
MNKLKHIYEIFPKILYVVDRTTNLSWKLDDHMSFYNLMLIYDGKAEFTCNNTTIQASNGYLLFYKPGDIRKAHTFSEDPMKCFGIDFLYTCPIYQDNQWQFVDSTLPFSFFQKIDDQFLFSRLLDLFSRLNRFFLSNKDINRVNERSVFSEILILLLEYKDGNQYNYSNLKRVDKIINYMAENYMENITLQQLADYSKISPSYLGNIFNKVIGASTIEYLINIRITKAKSLLKDGLTISETSKLVGFNDIFYFSKAFKKREGISPSQYIELVNS